MGVNTLIVRLVMDAAGYMRTIDTAVASNTKLDASIEGIGATASVSAEKQVAASLKSTKALEGQIAGYRELAASASATAETQARATLLADRAQTRLNASMGISALATSSAGKAAQTGERDFGKLTRGVLAGSGAASSLGRSLAFASTGFIAVAGGATLLAASIKASIDLAKTQRQVEAQLKTSGKSWDTYGTRIDAADLKLSHLSGFTNQELLQGFGFLVRGNNNVAESLKLTAEAADVARGRGISLASASIALAKAQGGSLTALRRLGIVVPANVKGMAALEFVQRKFAGQAQAGATVQDHFHASLVNTEEVIGNAVLPTFTRLTTEFGNYLDKLDQSGHLQHNIDEGLHLIGIGFHIVEGAIHAVDVVTGSFGHTLLTIGEIWAGIKVIGWIGSLQKLAVTWGLVEGAATKAAVAEAAAAGAGAVGAAEAVGASTLAARIAPYTLAGQAAAEAEAAAAAKAAAANRGFSGFLGRTGLGRIGGGIGLAVGGTVAGQIAGNLIPGQAGRTTSSALQFAGLGAGLGTFIEPGVGTAVGAGVGALAGAVISLIHSGPTLQQTLERDAAAVSKLGQSAHQAALNITSIRLQRFQLQDTLASQQQAVASARSAVSQTAPGTAARVTATRQLREAELALQQTEQQLKVTNDNLTNAEKKQAAVRAVRQKATADEAKRVLDLAKSYTHLQQSIKGGGVTSTADIDTLMQSVKDGTDKAGNATDAFEIKIGELAQKASPHLKHILGLIRDLTSALNGVPSNKDIKLIFSGQGNFRVGPGGSLFPTGPRGVPGGGASPVPGKTPVAVYATYSETISQQIAAAQAALTKTTTDDVRVAKSIIARIKRLISQGKLGGQSLLQGLQDEATQQSVLDQARQQAAQQAAAIAAAKKQAASSYATPIDLQLAEARSQLTASTKDDLRIERQILAAAKAAIAAGKKNKAGQLAALQVELQAQQAIQSLTGQSSTTFTLPLKLQLALAKAQALGTDQGGILLRMKAALEKALKSAKGNIQKQIDIYNQIAAINSQLNSDVTNAYGDFKKASVKALTQNLGLTADQRRRLEARLSQRGPGGTTPGTGVGAAGYIIDPATGRPRHSHQQPGQGRPVSGGAGGGGGTPALKATINLTVNIDGKQVEATVTKHQQRRRRHNPTQTRGPHAATSTA